MIQETTACNGCTTAGWYGEPCTRCQAGYYCPANSPNYISCQMNKCPPGTFSGEVAGSCTLCPAGSYSNQYVATTCKPCPAGTWTNLTGQISCSFTCPLGTYSLSGSKNASACFSCPAGYYCPEGVLTSCPAGSYSSLTNQISISTCQSCPQGMYSAAGSTSASDCKPCEAGYYCPGGVKTPCPAGTSSSATNQIDRSTCTPCSSGYYSTANSSICSICPTGSFCENGIAAKCPTGTYSPQTGLLKCLTCQDGTYSTSAGKTACSTCSSGGYCANGIRTACPQGTYSSGTGKILPSACSSVPEGAYAYSPGATNYYWCLKGYYCTGATLTACPSGTYQDVTGQASCKRCPAGQYSTSTTANMCTACPAGSFCSNSIKSLCPAGKYTDLSGQSTCITCTDGTFSAAGSNSSASCLPCSSGYYCQNGQKLACPAGTYSSTTGQSSISACQICQDGYYSSVGSTSCIACGLGYYCSGGVRTACASGTYNPTNSYAVTSSSCIACPTGYSCSISSKSMCSRGKYCENGVSYSCPSGHYSDAWYSTSCKKCPNGKYSTSMTSEMCIDCPPGSICPDSTSPQPCPAGTFHDQESKTCQPCASGTFSKAGATLCTVCSPGFYCPDPAQKIACPSGTYQPYTSQTLSSSCMACPSGQYSESGASMCGCPPGSYCANGERNLCPLGTYQKFTNKTSIGDCLSCPAGTYADTAGTAYLKDCKFCGEGRTSLSGSISISNCQPCPAGSYCPMGIETPCPEGTYRSSLYSPNFCATCPAGYYSSAGSITCSQLCPVGSHCPKGVLKLCPSGSYQDETGQTSCKACQAGTYQESDGKTLASDCLVCPSSTPFSPSGASICSAVCPPGYYCSNGVTTACPANTFSTLGASDASECLTISEIVSSCSYGSIIKEIFDSESLKGSFGSLPENIKYKLVQCLTDGQLKELTETQLDELSLSITLDHMKLLMQDRGKPVDRLLFSWLKAYKGTCYPGYDFDLLKMAYDISTQSLNAKEYFTNTIRCLYQNQLNEFLTLIKPYLTGILYRLKPLSSITDYPFTEDTVYTPSVTSLDAKVSAVLPDLTDPTTDIEDLILQMIDREGRSLSVSNECYQIRETRWSPNNITVWKRFLSTERLGCFLAVAKTNLITNSDPNILEVLPFGLALKYGYYKRLANFDSDLQDFQNDILFLIGQLAAAKGQTLDELIDKKSKEYYALMNAMPSFDFMDALFTYQLVSAYHQEKNGLSLADSRAEARDTMKHFLKQRITAESLNIVLDALYDHFGIPRQLNMKRGVQKRATTANSALYDATMREIALAAGTTDTLTNIFNYANNTFPYCLMRAGDFQGLMNDANKFKNLDNTYLASQGVNVNADLQIPNTGCVFALMLGCFGNSESSCVKSFNTFFWSRASASQSVANMKACSCTSSQADQIRTSACKTASNVDEVTKTLLVRAINMEPISYRGNPSTSTNNYAFYASSKCSVSNGGRGFVYVDENYNANFGDLTKVGNVVKCSNGATLTTTSTSC